MDFKYTITEKKDYALISFEGSLIEVHQTDNLMHDIDELFFHEKNKFAIDLSKLEYINNVGIGVLFKLLSLARKNGGELTLYNLSDSVKKMPEGKKIQEIFTMSENEFLAAALLLL